MRSSGAMPKPLSEARKGWEGIKLPLVTMGMRLEMLELRLRQAVERYGATDLLGPALRQVREMGQDKAAALQATNALGEMLGFCHQEGEDV